SFGFPHPAREAAFAPWGRVNISPEACTIVRNKAHGIGPILSLGWAWREPKRDCLLTGPTAMVQLESARFNNIGPASAHMGLQGSDFRAQLRCCVNDTGPQPTEPLVVKGHQLPGSDCPQRREAPPLLQP